MECAKCNRKINRTDDKLKCSGLCKAIYHPQCMNISVTKLAEMKNDSSLGRWKCPKCDNDVVQGDLTLVDIGAMIQDLKAENTSLRKSIDQMHTKLDDQTIKFEQLINKIRDLEVENEQLRHENGKLRTSIDEQEQYSRRNCVEIHGLPEIQGEIVLSEVIKVGRAVGLEVTPSMIDNCHRLGNPKSQAIRGIIVKFVRNSDKMKLLHCRKTKRDLSSVDLGFNTVPSSIYINENLTQYRRSLLSHARQLRKTCNIMYVWTRNGNIYLRENEKTPVIKVTSPDDLTEVERKCKEKAQRVLDGVDQN